MINADATNWYGISGGLLTDNTTRGKLPRFSKGSTSADAHKHD